MILVAQPTDPPGAGLRFSCGDRVMADDSMSDMKGGTNVVRILFVDDHPVVRMGIRQIIDVAPGLSGHGEAESAEAALAWLKHSEADLAIVDLSLGTMHGLDLIRELCVLKLRARHCLPG